MAASVLALAGCEQAPTLLIWSPAPASQRAIVNPAAPAAGEPYLTPNVRKTQRVVATSRPPPARPLNPIAGNPATVVVRRGETLYAISRRYHVPLRLLLDANRLSPPYHILAGEHLDLPKPETHVVQPHETLYGLSRRYHVGLYEIASANDISAPYRLEAGAVLVIPPPEGGPPAPPLERLPPPTASPPITVAERAAPPLPQAAPRGRATLAPPHPAIHRNDDEANRTGRRHTADRRNKERRGNIRRPASVKRTPPAVATRLAVPVDRRHPFLWPVKGRLLVGFGPESNGLDNDGINIAVPEGTPVHAAAAGTVVYAGDELRGYGNLILIRHADGWITAYAHNAKLLVRSGQHVSRGEIIARAGETGGVASPQLHFEIRHGARPVDPLHYLSALRKTNGTRSG